MPLYLLCINARDQLRSAQYVIEPDRALIRRAESNSLARVKQYL